MADFDFSTLITDRGQSDLATLRSVLSTPMEDWTAEQLAAFNLAASKGAYNYTDLNRVTQAMDAINERLTELGYQTGYQRVVVPHREGGGSVLPEGYTQVAYIESTGTQYIDTDYVIQSEHMHVTMKFAYIGEHNDSSLFGSETSGLTGPGEYSICPYGTPTFYVGGSKNLAAAYQPKLNEICLLDVEANEGTLRDTWNKSITATRAYTIGLNHSYSVSVFCNNVSGSKMQFAPIRLFSFKLQDNGNLIRDYIPCIDPSGEAGLYDLVNDQFYGNSGTGVFLPGPAQVELPDGYTQLEYIESSGTQWIDTGVHPSNQTVLSLDAYILSTNSSGTHHIASSNTNSSYFALRLNESNNGYSARWGFGSLVEVPYDGTVFSRHLFTFGNGSCKMDGASAVQLSSSAFEQPNALPLCGYVGANNTVANFTSMQIYLCELYKDGTLIRNYVPCQEPGGAVGLYDLVNHQFYANAGTGAFAAGPEVSWPEPVPDPEPALDPYIWYEIDVPTASAMAAYLANVAALRGVLTLPDNTAAVPADMDGLTVDEANAIEEILLILYNYLTALQKIFLRSGMAWAVSGGPGFYFVN